MAKRQERFALLGYFEKIEKRKRGAAAPINKHVGQWESDALIESYGIDVCKQLIDRFFMVSANPKWKTFVYNAEKLYNDSIAEKEDREHRALINKRMKEWMK